MTTHHPVRVTIGRGDAVSSRSGDARSPGVLVDSRTPTNGGWMEAHDQELGPIDIVVIGFPADAPMTGDAVPLLVDLVERGIIRVLDVLFVTQNEDGTVSGFEASDL